MTAVDSSRLGPVIGRVFKEFQQIWVTNIYIFKSIFYRKMIIVLN